MYADCWSNPLYHYLDTHHMQHTQQYYHVEYIGSDYRIWDNGWNTEPTLCCYWCLRPRCLCLQIKLNNLNNHRMAHFAISHWCQYSCNNVCTRRWNGRKLCLIGLSGGHLLYVWPFWRGECKNAIVLTVEVDIICWMLYTAVAHALGTFVFASCSPFSSLYKRPIGTITHVTLRAISRRECNSF